MDFQVNFRVSPAIFIKDPESSEVGKQIVKHSIDLIHNLGFEQFTFKKLAAEINSTEATIYRYFENKHRLLLYILNWYWSYMEFLFMFRLQNVSSPAEKLSIVIDLLTHDLSESSGLHDYNRKALNAIVIAESSKVYLTKEVNEINKTQAFKPYKDLCNRIASVIGEYNPEYKYPKSLSSTIIETAHQQQFFSTHLPRLTDNVNQNAEEFAGLFIKDLIFTVLEKGARR
jgi:hypothetical protein